MRMTFFGAAVLALMPAVAIAASHNERMSPTQSEIVALARAQMDATIARKPVADRMSAIADDYSLFNAFASTRIDGKAEVMSLNMASDAGGTKPLSLAMLNPRVQVYGDSAVLTYNAFAVNQRKDGATSESNVRVSRVYARSAGRWMNVHTHISYVPTSTN